MKIKLYLTPLESSRLARQGGVATRFAIPFLSSKNVSAKSSPLAGTGTLEMKAVGCFFCFVG